MEQFSLDKWLQDKSRKVVTRDGREVDILKTNRKDGIHPIIFSFLDQNGVEQVRFCNKDGICTTLPRPNKLDLFFADEEEEMNEFEKELNRIVQAFVDAHSYMDKVEIHHYAKGLLDLARKEILESLPKWKKANKETDFEERVLIYEDDYICYDDHVYIDDYYIERNELKKPPKAE